MFRRKIWHNCTISRNVDKEVQLNKKRGRTEMVAINTKYFSLVERELVDFDGTVHNILDIVYSALIDTSKLYIKFDKTYKPFVSENSSQYKYYGVEIVCDDEKYISANDEIVVDAIMFVQKVNDWLAKDGEWGISGLHFDYTDEWEHLRW